MLHLIFVDALPAIGIPDSEAKVFADVCEYNKGIACCPTLNVS